MILTDTYTYPILLQSALASVHTRSSYDHFPVYGPHREKWGSPSPSPSLLLESRHWKAWPGWRAGCQPATTELYLGRGSWSEVTAASAQPNGSLSKPPGERPLGQKWEGPHTTPHRTNSQAAGPLASSSLEIAGVIMISPCKGRQQPENYPAP